MIDGYFTIPDEDGYTLAFYIKDGSYYEEERPPCGGEASDLKEITATDYELAREHARSMKWGC